MHRVAVIGCGVIGLTSALQIQNTLGSVVAVTIFTDQRTPHTTGDVAAGLWMPYLVQNTAEDLVVEWSRATQNYVLALWRSGKAEQAGISLQLITKVTDQQYKLPKWVAITFGHSELTPNTLDALGSRLGKKLTGGYSFVGFVWEASKFLPYLEQEFLRSGGRIVQRRIENFVDLKDFDVIVNCTGLGAAALVPDAAVTPIRGQIVRAEAPWQFDTVAFDTADCNYVIPNQGCVVMGGTQQRGDSSLEISATDSEHILSGCQRLVSSLSAAQVLSEVVGLRPGREQVRLELEVRKTGKDVLRIVHNYGHGGSGVTLCIGCAETCANIVKHALLQSKL